MSLFPETLLHSVSNLQDACRCMNHENNAAHHRPETAPPLMRRGQQQSYLPFPHSRQPASKVLGRVDRMGEETENECNHSAMSEQQSGGPGLCKPSGLVIIVWTQGWPVGCQGAAQQSHCQFVSRCLLPERIKTRASNLHSDLTATISHQPLSYNLFHCVLFPLDMLMEVNWPILSLN